MISQESKSIVTFYINLDYYTEMLIKQLLQRLSYQKKFKKTSFNLLYGENIWKHSPNSNLN